MEKLLKKEIKKLKKHGHNKQDAEMLARRNLIFIKYNVK